ncbi:MAG: hypothetical protein K2X39_02355, partial [Silvanigrellaceae bacterium]|nr:hypothetical protein [Silvanigrellaceae bacterium]
MNQVSLAKLRDLSDQLTIVAGTFQMPPSALRVQQIRKADKSLIVLEAFFTSAFTEKAKHWKTAFLGAHVLKQKLSLFQKKQTELSDIEKKLSELSEITQPWVSLPHEMKQNILENFNRAYDFIKDDKMNTEGNLLSQFEKLIKLEFLIPYA